MDHRWPQFIIKTEDLFRADCGLKQQQSRLHKKEQGNRQGWESSQEDKLAWMGTKFGTISLCNQPKVRNSGTIRHKMTTRNSKSGYFSPTNWVKPPGTLWTTSNHFHSKGHEVAGRAEASGVAGLFGQCSESWTQLTQLGSRTYRHADPIPPASAGHWPLPARPAEAIVPGHNHSFKGV